MRFAHPSPAGYGLEPSPADPLGMNNMPPHHKPIRRSLGIALCLGLAGTLVASTAQASTSGDWRSKRNVVTVISKDPVRPTAGQNYTVNFTLMKGKEQVAFEDFDCLAVWEKGTLSALKKERSGQTATCTWAIPAEAKGKKLHGIFAIVVDKDTTSFRGWEKRIS
jgi:hypothetical protein